MKLMKCHLLVAAFALGLCADLLAGENSHYPTISMVGAGKTSSVTGRDELVILVVEGRVISHDAKVIPDAGLVDYVNSLLQVKKASYIGVYAREGVSYGDVVKALDALRKTDAKDIGVSMSVLPAGREL